MGLGLILSISIPTSINDWLMQILPLLLGIWSERSNKTLMGAPYLYEFLKRFLITGLIGFLSNDGAIQLGLPFVTPVLSEDLATPSMHWVGAGLYALFRFLTGRILVQRLRDGGASKRWAYLAVLPFADVFMVLGAIIYPLSKTGEHAASYR